MEKVKQIGEIHEIKISDIIIEDRVRVDMGDIENLALSIHMEGLLYPLIVSQGPGNKYILVEGERRIHAVKSLGWTKVKCILLDALSEVKRGELELIMCVQRKQLSFIEEARAVRDLVEKRKQGAALGGLHKFGDSIRNKDVAMELNMTESRMSENLRIADAVKDHPELETEAVTRSDMLRRIRKQEYFVPQGGYLQKMYEENFIVQTPLGCLDTIPDKIIDLCILHPDGMDMGLLDATVSRLKLSGQVIIFCEHKDIPAWETAVKDHGMNVGRQPYIWSRPDTGDYSSYIWAGKNMSGPLRAIPMMISAKRPPKSLSKKAKPMQLINFIVKCCTERGSFVVVPSCEDIETIRCCVEVGRNIRAACGNRVMRDRLILSVTEGN